MIRYPVLADVVIGFETPEIVKLICAEEGAFRIFIYVTNLVPVAYEHDPPARRPAVAVHAGVMTVCEASLVESYGKYTVIYPFAGMASFGLTVTVMVAPVCPTSFLTASGVMVALVNTSGFNPEILALNTYPSTASAGESALIVIPPVLGH